MLDKAGVYYGIAWRAFWELQTDQRLRGRSDSIRSKFYISYNFATPKKMVAESKHYV